MFVQKIFQFMNLKYFTKIFRFSFFTIVLAHYVNCYDAVQQYVDDINEVIKHAETYKYRLNNSDIYSDGISSKSNYGEFDFVIVGAGSAGAVVARRLSDNKFKTLLLEAGSEQNNMTDIPGINNLFQKSDFNWGYKTAPQQYACQGMVNRQCSSPRGKVMGGSSALNGMIYARGNQNDQDMWGRVYGLTGWGWKDTLPYFKKLENCESFGGDPDYRGLDGPVHIDISRPPRYLNHIFLQANKEFYKTTDDYNGEQQLGAGLLQFNKRDGRRASSNRAYLTSYKKKYLTIETNAFVTKVLIERKMAKGVEFIKDNRKYHVKAKKEVILSAGAINTPQILMLSGIGPKDELNKHQISVIEDLPVGKNLDDHIGYIGIQFVSNLTIVGEEKPLDHHVWDFLSQTGALSDTGLQSVAFYSTINETIPDIEIIFIPSGRGIVPGINNFNLNEESLEAMALPDNEIDRSYVMLVILLHGKSRGSVTLQSKNPKDFPIINPNSLSNYEDVDILYKAMDYIQALEKTEAFKSINGTMRRINLPACRNKEFDSRDYWHCTIRHLSHQLYHPVGTCAMGKEGSSVLDSNLKVRGIKGLRIVDASAAPTVSSGHTNALAMMIGEKAADIIKNDY